VDTFFLIVGAIIIVMGLIFLRIRCFPALHPDAEMFIDLLSVITVCDESVENECPVFPGIARRLHWLFPDPQKVTGTKDEKL
jgi:hypothetical protein